MLSHNLSRLLLYTLSAMRNTSLKNRFQNNRKTYYLFLRTSSFNERTKKGLCLRFSRCHSNFIQQHPFPLWTGECAALWLVSYHPYMCVYINIKYWNKSVSKIACLPMYIQKTSNHESRRHSVVGTRHGHCLYKPTYASPLSVFTRRSLHRWCPSQSRFVWFVGYKLDGTTVLPTLFHSRGLK